jgi:hypothetical protein
MAADNDKRDSKKALEEEVWSAIAAFEQILEAMPSDRASLEALAHAYQQVGDHTRAKDYLVRLGNVLLEEADFTSARELVERLQPYVAEDKDAEKLVKRIESVEGQESSLASPVIESPATTTVPAGKPGAGSKKVRSTFSMPDELSMAWNLLESNELSQEEYSAVVQDLTEMSTKDANTTVSVLHVLQDRGFKNLHKVLVSVSKACGTPVVSLSHFDLQPEAVSLLPAEFMLRRGAILFEKLGSHGLVVVMNPYDKQLRKDIEEVAGIECHFFVTLPEEFDLGLQKAGEITSGSGEASG